MDSCQICFEEEAKYKIQCGSTTPHTICYSCETSWRLNAKPDRKGRHLICPFCRGVEKKSGNRSRGSYEAELARLYKDLHSGRSSLHYEFQSQIEMANSSQPTPVARIMVQPRRIFDEIVASVARQTPVPRPPAPIDPASRPVPVVPLPPVAPVPASRPKHWCQSGRRELGLCTTQGKTQRKCSYPSGCEQFVCRDCRMCISHFPSS